VVALVLLTLCSILEYFLNCMFQHQFSNELKITAQQTYKNSKTDPKYILEVNKARASKQKYSMDFKTKL
jgi:hypothetical protein